MVTTLTEKNKAASEKEKKESTVSAQNITQSDHCPCGSTKTYSKCCAVYIDGKKSPPSPEMLMRSRYTAYTQANIDYIAQTMKGAAAKDFFSAETKRWAEHVKWLGLTILHISPIENNDHGFVEFKIDYLFNGKRQGLHEISEFRYEEGKWFYIDGEAGDTNSVIQKPERIGRNEVCPCGSGKKYKKCCAAV